MVGTHPAFNAWVGNGSTPGLSFLERIADALDATIEIKLKPKLLSSQKQRPARKAGLCFYLDR
jgi:hypothetical protein